MSTRIGLLFGMTVLLMVSAYLHPNSVAFSSEYQVGSGDTLEVRVLGEAEFSGTFRIGSDGALDYPYLRRISVAGKTTEEIAALLAEKLEDGYLMDPQVSVEVKVFRSQQVVVLGAVNKPGTYILKESTRLLDLISKAGGISEKGGKRIIVIRDQAENEAQPEIHDVPPEARPYNYPGNMESIAESDSLDVNDPSKAILVDYYRLLHKGDLSQNILMKNGDIVNVPEANEIFVLGQVARPGPIRFTDQMTILQAVTLAGGPTQLASTKSTYIIRQSAEGEKKVKVRFDRIMENEAKNILVQADDVIVIPESFF